MGGRGGSSGLSKNATQSFKNAGVEFKGMENLNKTAVEKTLQGLKDVLQDMRIPLSSIYNISGDSIEATAATDGLNKFVFSKEVYSSLEQVNKRLSNMKNVVADNLYGIGAHEAGHIIVNEIINKTMKNSSFLEKMKTRKSNKIEKQVIRQATKQYGSSPQISKYASTKAQETIAEAVADVYTNKSRANPYSRVIVDILKKKLRG